MKMYHYFPHLGGLKRMRVNKIRFTNIFYNNKFVFIFSIILSTLIWIIVSLVNTDSYINFKIGDIPINIQLSDNAKNNDLMVFFIDKNSASVSVSGSSLALSKLTSDSINVTSFQASEIDRSGTYELNLTAKQNDNMIDYEIDQNSLTPKKVKVLVDRYKELKIPITDNVNYRTDSQYFASTTKFIPENVTVSGPESVVSKVAKVKAEYNITQTLNESKTFFSPIVLYDENDNKLSDNDLSMLTISDKNVQCEIPILKKTTLPLLVNLENKPIEFDANSRVKITPSTVEVAIPVNNTDFNNIMLQKIDFSNVDLNNNKFEMMVELPEGYKNLSNAYTAQVEFDMTGLQAKVIDVNNFQFTNLASDKSAKALTGSIQVEVVGPEDQIEYITGQNVTATVDLANKSNFTGHTEMPVKFTINGANGCWIYGNYKISISINEA